MFKVVLQKVVINSHFRKVTLPKMKKETSRKIFEVVLQNVLINSQIRKVTLPKMKNVSKQKALFRSCTVKKFLLLELFVNK